MQDKRQSEDANETGGAAAPISLLWPPGAAADAAGGSPNRAAMGRLDADCVRDLGLDNLMAALTGSVGDGAAVRQTLLALCQDARVIGYRQDVLADLLDRPTLLARLTDLTPRMDAVVRYSQRGTRERSTLQEVIWRLGELESYVECMTGLAAAFEGVDALRSAGLAALRQAVTSVIEGESFRRLARELPDLLAQVRATASVTIGVNLDEHLRPVEATLLSINGRKFRSGSFLSKLLGAAGGPGEGIAPLHGIAGRYAGAAPGGLGPDDGFSPMLVPLFRDLALILERTAQPIAETLRLYAGVSTGLLAGLRRELPFYLGAARLINGLRARGLPMCRPEIAPAEERVCEATDAYHINLALHLAETRADHDLSQTLVANDIAFGPAARIIILTGPNQGGKTTYIQSIGLIQVMAQAGLFVPGRSARISPVDGLYTHFPTEEALEKATGRFGDEAQRLHDIFARVTRRSLALLNESLSGTSAGESLYLCQDIVRVLRLLGARAIFATHLHELAAGIDALNAAEPGDSVIASMIASPMHEDGGAPASDADRRSYRVIFAPPMGRSYAEETARRYGVSYDQLRGLLAGRGLLEPPPTAPPDP